MLRVEETLDSSDFFNRSFGKNAVIANYAHLLGRYATNSPLVNSCVVAYLRRMGSIPLQAGTLRTALFTLPCIATFEAILADPEMKREGVGRESRSGVRAFALETSRAFLAMAQTNPMVFVEVMFNVRRRRVPAPPSLPASASRRCALRDSSACRLVSCFPGTLSCVALLPPPRVSASASPPPVLNVAAPASRRARAHQLALLDVSRKHRRPRRAQGAGAASGARNARQRRRRVGEPLRGGGGSRRRERRRGGGGGVGRRGGWRAAHEVGLRQRSRVPLRFARIRRSVLQFFCLLGYFLFALILFFAHLFFCRFFCSHSKARYSRTIAPRSR